MDWWLVGLSVGQGCTFLAALWIAVRLRTRGIVGTWSTSSTAIQEPHQHEYAHNPGDGRFYCACGESKKLGD